MGFYFKVDDNKGHDIRKFMFNSKKHFIIENNLLVFNLPRDITPVLIPSNILVTIKAKNKQKERATMKVFVYSKSTSKKIATITNVCSILYSGITNQIFITTVDGVTFDYSTDAVKTTIYQD